MTQEMRQEIVKLARELPDEVLAEALVFLHSLAQKAQWLWFGEKTSIY